MEQNNVKKILNEIFTQRGYFDIENTSLLTKVKNFDHDDMEILAGTDPERKEEVWAFLNIIPKLNINEIGMFIKILSDSGINHCIIVFYGSPTPNVKGAILEISKLKKSIELFQVEDLQINITKHRLVPNHKKLSKEESKNFREKYGTSIPTMLRIDPIAKFYDYRKGDIIEISDKYGVRYRIVK